VCDHRGQDKGGFYALVPTPTDLPPSNFPRKLSDSGLFAAVPGHVMKPGVIPYSVNAPFWSDGAHKERWLALPGEAPKIEFIRNRSWTLPDKAVLIKSFALDAPQGRKWIETRFLTKQDGEWYGYSYVWNDEQTDATLVQRGGEDRIFDIQTPGGAAKQSWHFPSRAECMVCHSRAANYVLGLSTAQMNKEHDYGGVFANQLSTLEHLGFFHFSEMAHIEEIENQLHDVGGVLGRGLHATFAPLDGYLPKPPPIAHRMLDTLGAEANRPLEWLKNEVRQRQRDTAV